MSIRQIVEQILMLTDSFSPPEDSNNNCERLELLEFLNLAKDGYIRVYHPESQEYTDEKWFKEEAILDMKSSSFGTYFIPIGRVYEYNIIKKTLSNE